MGTTSIDSVSKLPQVQIPFGILVVDKPKDMTSHDVVDIVRRKFGIRRVGHAGTLDPMATGVLVILIGRATKLSASFAAHDKEYECVLTLGSSTTTDDATGKVLATTDISGIPISRDTIINVLGSFLGEMEQIPPMHSAIKHKGQPLYKLARRGLVVPRRARKVCIHEIELVDIAMPEIRFKIRCSKGTYIRTICAEIGKKIGLPAHMSYLRRSRSGPFTIDRALALADLERLPLSHIKDNFLWRSYTN